MSIEFLDLLYKQKILLEQNLEQLQNETPQEVLEDIEGDLLLKINALKLEFCRNSIQVCKNNIVQYLNSHR